MLNQSSSNPECVLPGNSQLNTDVAFLQLAQRRQQIAHLTGRVVVCLLPSCLDTRPQHLPGFLPAILSG